MYKYNIGGNSQTCKSNVFNEVTYIGETSLVIVVQDSAVDINSNGDVHGLWEIQF